MTFSDWISLGGILVGILGIGFAVWQYKKYTNLHKIVNDYIRGMYVDSKKIIENCSNKDNIQQIESRTRAIKHNLIRLDIMNRGLNREKIERYGKDGKFTNEEVKEYREFSSE